MGEAFLFARLAAFFFAFGFGAAFPSPLAACSSTYHLGGRPARPGFHLPGFLLAGFFFLFAFFPRGRAGAAGGVAGMALSSRSSVSNSASMAVSSAFVDAIRALRASRRLAAEEDIVL